MLKDSIKHIYEKFILISVSIICLYALYLRIMFLSNHTLWADESLQLSQLQGTFLELLKSAPKNFTSLYLSGDIYIVFPFFKIFSYNKYGLAIPHIIVTMIGFYILYLICKRYFKSIWAYFITFGIVCFNATLIEHSTEIRPYAVLPTLALATFYLFERIADFNFKLNTIKKIWAIVFFISVILFHVYGILMFISCFLFTLLSKYKEKDFKVNFKNAISFTGIILYFAMPLWLYSVFGQPIGANVGINPYAFIPSPFHNIAGFLKAIFGNLIGFRNLYFLLLGLIIPFIFSYKDKHKQLLFLCVNIIFPIVFIFLFDIAAGYWFLQRQFIWVMPLFAFFLGWAWDSFFMLLKRNREKRD